MSAFNNIGINRYESGPIKNKDGSGEVELIQTADAGKAILIAFGNDRWDRN